ncbi:unnamed protein product [Amoebophrya sp. A120]|nr:unnamed protein product [Amoebophrya sp. A120]|eukprot:GSA120T00008134001.1
MATFDERKAKTLLAIDKSPKGSFDAPILDLLSYINSLPNYCTTSSCSGRIAVFQHNRKEPTRSGGKSVFSSKSTRRVEKKKSSAAAAGEDEMRTARTSSAERTPATCSSPPADAEQNARSAGENALTTTTVPSSDDPVADLVTQHRTTANNADKGGSWVFVDHEPNQTDLFTLSSVIRRKLRQLDEDTHIDFLFESFVLHVEARDIASAQKFLTLALQCGYRESGMCVSGKSRCMVQVRTNAFGMTVPCRVSDLAFSAGWAGGRVNNVLRGKMEEEENAKDLMSFWLSSAMERFAKNKARTEKFFDMLKHAGFERDQGQETSCRASRIAEEDLHGTSTRLSSPSSFGAAAPAAPASAPVKATTGAAKSLNTKSSSRLPPAVLDLISRSGGALVCEKSRAKYWKDTVQEKGLFDKKFGVKCVELDVVHQNLQDYTTTGENKMLVGLTPEGVEQMKKFLSAARSSRRAEIAEAHRVGGEAHHALVYFDEAEKEIDFYVMDATELRAAVKEVDSGLVKARNHTSGATASICKNAGSTTVNDVVEDEGAPAHTQKVDALQSAVTHDSNQQLWCRASSSRRAAPDRYEWTDESWEKLSESSGDKFCPVEFLDYLLSARITFQPATQTICQFLWCVLQQRVSRAKLYSLSPDELHQDRDRREELQPSTSPPAVFVPELPAWYSELSPPSSYEDEHITTTSTARRSTPPPQLTYQVQGKFAFIENIPLDLLQRVLAPSKTFWLTWYAFLVRRHPQVEVIGVLGEVADDDFRSPKGIQLFCAVSSTVHHDPRGAGLGYNLNTLEVCFNPAGRKVLLQNKGGTTSSAISSTERKPELCRPHVWNRVSENGVHYTWNVLKTMFCKGNISEKIRVRSKQRSVSSRDENVIFACSNGVDQQHAHGYSIHPDETVVDLFAGIGYWTLPILKELGEKGKVYACEWNPASVEGLRRGYAMNFPAEQAKSSSSSSTNRNIKQRLTILQGDCTVVAPKTVADRVILGLLPDTEKFRRTAAECLNWEEKTRVKKLHIHQNLREDTDFAAYSSKICQDFLVLQKETRENEYGSDESYCDFEVKVEHIQRVKSYAPRVSHYVFDVAFLPRGMDAQL